MDPPRRGIRRDISPVVTLLSSNVVGAAAGGVFFLVASRSFDLEEMGRYTVAIGVQWILVGLVGSGLSVAVIRLAADAIAAGDRPAAAETVSVGIVLSAGLGIALGALGFASPGLGGTLGWIALWGGARSVLDCIRAGLLVEQRYRRAAALMIVSAATGIGALVLTLLGGPLTLERLLRAHTVGLGSAAGLALLFLRPLGALGIRLTVARVRAVVSYARWPAFSEGTRMLQANLGAFLLLGVAGSAEAGLFGLGRYPAYLFEVVAVSLYQYWLPEATRMRDAGGLSRFLGAQTRLAALVGLGMVVGAFAVRPFLPWLGPNFAAAGALFVISTLDFALFLLARPIESVFHGMHRPHFELLLRVARIPILVGLGWGMLSSFGAAGMAWAYVASGAATLLLAVWLVRRLLRGDHGPTTPDP